MHSCLLAAQSPVLDAMVNGGMKESRERCVTWEHVEEHTFFQFSKFAYSGDFTIHDPGENAEGSPTADSAVRCADQGRHLIQHAELMVFAEMYAIDGLLALAASKLEEILTGMSITADLQDSKQPIQAVTDLVRFCFDTTTPDIVQNPTVPILKKHAAILWEDDRFRAVVRDCPELAVAFINCNLQKQPAAPRVLQHSELRLRCVRAGLLSCNVSRTPSVYDSLNCNYCGGHCEITFVGS